MPQQAKRLKRLGGHRREAQRLPRCHDSGDPAAFHPDGADLQQRLQQTGAIAVTLGFRAERLVAESAIVFGLLEECFAGNAVR